MDRKIGLKVMGEPAIDGAGVRLTRVLGHTTTKDFDPILMLDSFDSKNPEDYVAGFPMHPHRGIETISYVYKGKMKHKDSLGSEDTIGDGEVQWMTTGSGIMHAEELPESKEMLGVQLWLNMPSKNKMESPSYRSIKNSEISEIEFDGGILRLLAGEYKGYKTFDGDYVNINYYDIHLNDGNKIDIPVDKENFAMIFTLKGDVNVAQDRIKEKTAVKLVDGDNVCLEANNGSCQVLFLSARPLNENIAWAGPIVMNSQQELNQAFLELRENRFLKEEAKY